MRRLYFILVFILCPISGLADSILISQTGTGTSGWTTGAEEANAFSWSSTATISNMTISAKLLNEPDGVTHYTAYLTTRLVAGWIANASQPLVPSEILMTRDFQPSGPAGNQWIDVLSGLTLDPGTYYLTIGGTRGGWASTATDTTLTTTLGLSYNGSFFATNAQRDFNPIFPLDSTFYRFEDYGQNSFPLQFSITGSIVQVAGPTSLALLALGLVVLSVSAWLRPR